MKFGDEILQLEGNNVKVARIISRITGAPLINLYVGIIMTIIAPLPTIGTILDSILALILCIVFMVILPVTPIIFEAWRGNVDLDVSSQNMRTQFFLFAILCYVISFSIFYLLLKLNTWIFLKLRIKVGLKVYLNFQYKGIIYSHILSEKNISYSYELVFLATIRLRLFLLSDKNIPSKA